MKVGIRKDLILKYCWVWDRTVEDLVKEKIKGYSLNICAGHSKIGDVKIDLDPQDRSIIKGDMKNLPFGDNKFDTVIQDPPWKIGIFDRYKAFFECVRVCKVGGQIIYNAYWIPWSKCTNLIECYVRQDYIYSNASTISIFKKVKDDPNLDLNQLKFEN